MYEYYLDQLMKAKPNTVKFNLVCNDSKYIYIHPVKQQKVKGLVDELIALDTKKEITKIIVFGSATTFNCSSYSDIDILVLGTFEEFSLPIHTSRYGKVDLLTYNEDEFNRLLPTTKIFEKILQEGLIVYE